MNSNLNSTTLNAQLPNYQPVCAAPPPDPNKNKSRGNGKVARLPAVLRDKVNAMLDDGFTYEAIIQKLNESTDPPLPYPLSEMNISRWKDNGYQKYLRQQDCRAVLRELRQSAADIADFNDGPQFQETLVQLGLTDIFRTLRDGKIRSDPSTHIRVLNALARLNNQATSLNKFKAHP